MSNSKERPTYLEVQRPAEDKAFDADAALALTRATAANRRLWRYVPGTKGNESGGILHEWAFTVALDNLDLGVLFVDDQMKTIRLTRWCAGPHKNFAEANWVSPQAVKLLQEFLAKITAALDIVEEFDLDWDRK